MPIRQLTPIRLASAVTTVWRSARAYRALAEYQALRKQIVEEQQENERYTQQIQGLKSDQKSIEKEAREQLGYAKPGEYVYVPPVTARPAPPATHSAKK